MGKLLSKHEDLGLNAAYPHKSRHGRVNPSVPPSAEGDGGGRGGGVGGHTVTEPAKPSFSVKALKSKPMV